MFFWSNSARITNTQLGVDKVSGGITLVVEGEDAGEEVAPTIIVAPVNTTVIKDSSIAQLQCIANARYVTLYIFVSTVNPIEVRPIGGRPIHVI